MQMQVKAVASRETPLKLRKKEASEKIKKSLATTYSPTDKPQYHRRRSVSRSCSGWEFPGSGNDNMVKPHGLLVLVG